MAGAVTYLFDGRPDRVQRRPLNLAHDRADTATPSECARPHGHARLPVGGDQPMQSPTGILDCGRGQNRPRRRGSDRSRRGRRGRRDTCRPPAQALDGRAVTKILIDHITGHDLVQLVAGRIAQDPATHRRRVGDQLRERYRRSTVDPEVGGAGLHHRHQRPLRVEGGMARAQHEAAGFGKFTLAAGGIAAMAAAPLPCAPPGCRH